MTKKIEDNIIQNTVQTESAKSNNYSDFFTIIQNAPYGVALIDKDGRYLYLNPEFIKITGYELEDIPTGRDFLEKAYPDKAYRQEAIDYWKSDIARKGMERIFKTLCKYGDIKEIQFKPVQLDDGRHVLAISDLTRLKRFEEKIRENEEKYRILFEDSRDAIFISTLDGIITDFNVAYLDLFGYLGEEITQLNAKDTYYNLSDRDVFKQEIDKNGSVRDFEVKLKKKDGTVMDCILTATTRYSADGKAIGYQGAIRDITNKKHTAENLRNALKATHDIIENAPIGIYVMNSQGRIIYHNPALRRISDTTSEQLLEVNVLDVEGYRKVGLTEKMRKGLQGEPFTMNAVKYISHFGRRQTVRNFVGVPFDEAGEKRLLMFIEDITDQKFHEEELAYIATHDSLTGLPNRLLFNDRLQFSLAYAQRRRMKLAVLMLDLDRFKEVNDTLGHDKGDMLLRSVADRLTGTLRKADTVARMGGDEFIILLPDIKKAEDADTTASKILKVFQKPFVLDNHKLTVTTSIGIAIYPENGINSDSLTKHADIAMYCAKQNGRNKFQRYTENT